MGIIAGLLFFGGLAACIPLIILGVSIHRSSAKAKGRGSAWIMFTLTTIISIIAVAGIGLLFIVKGVSSGGAPTGSDYLSMLVFAAVLGLSPGVGSIIAAIVLDVVQAKKVGK